MRVGRAVAAGVLGGAIMSLLLWSARDGFEIPVSLALILGTMLGLEPYAWSTALAGLAMHLSLSALIALIYAWGFERVAHGADIRVGGIFGLIHAVIAGIALGLLPMVHPMIPERLAPLGAFMANLGGVGVAAFFLLHLLFGFIVGAIYAPVLSRRRLPEVA